MTEPTALSTPFGAPMLLIARSDARLARAAAQGDSRAFATIYQRYHQELYRYCHAILGDSHEAQDALQSTMASALRALPGDDRKIELRPWLYRVAYNESVSIMRRRNRTVAEPDDTAMLHEPSADVTFESRERLRSMVSDLGRLPERQRSALVMRELSGLSPDQIATALDVSAGAARQLVYEARVAMQEFSEGREMECERVRQAISDGDGRVLRGRRMRAHLRGCDGCTDFKAGIEVRSRDLQLIAPPLSAVAASGLLSSLLGGGSAASGGLLAGGIGGALTTKTLGLIAASAAIGVGAGTVNGVEVPGFGSDSPPPSAVIGKEASSAAGTAAPGAEHGSKQATSRGDGGAAAADRRRNGRAAGGADGAGQASAQYGEHAAEGSAAGGASTVAPAGGGQPATPPGSEVAGARSNGRSATPTSGPAEHASQGPTERAVAGGAGLAKKTETTP